MEDNVPTSLYGNAATRHPGSTSFAALLQTHALSLPVSAGMEVLHSSSSGVPSSTALPTNSVVTPPWGSSSGASSTVAVRQQSPVTKSVNSECDFQSPTAVHSDYQTNMDLDLDNTVAVLATSATNCVDFAGKVNLEVVGNNVSKSKSVSDPVSVVEKFRWDHANVMLYYNDTGKQFRIFCPQLTT